jgi:hypothetical protein
MIFWVDVSLKTYDRLVLMVEGRPFFYKGIQIRIDKLEFINTHIKHGRSHV